MADFSLVAKKNKEYFENLDNNYPNRHKEIHKVCCKKCPSNENRKAGIIDDESQLYKDNIPKEQLAKNHLFVCYARNSKLCKGLCDFMEIDQDYLNKIHENG